MSRRVIAFALFALVLALPRPAAAAQPGSGPFVSLDSVDPSILIEMRYTTSHNFIGRPIRGYEEPVCILTRQAALALKRAQAAARRRGYTLKVYDCYRPQRAVDDFVAWARDLRAEKMKAEFYPRVEKRRLFKEGYIAEKSGHSRASTVDLTLVRRPPRTQERYRSRAPLVDCASPAGVRFGDNSIDMGTGYDCFDPLSHTFNGRVRGVQRRNRLTLKHLLERQGFKPLAEEWWHFTLRREPFPDTAFDFPVRRDAVE
jgi:D-alanyl-D-alanine dipeptidase